MFGGDGGGGITLNNLLAGTRTVREYRRMEHTFPGPNRTLTSDPCPVEQALELWAAKGPAYLEMFASPVSAVQRLMAELLGAADEFRRLHISSAGDDSEVIDGDRKEDDLLVTTASSVSCCSHRNNVTFTKCSSGGYSIPQFSAYFIGDPWCDFFFRE